MVTASASPSLPPRASATPLPPPRASMRLPTAAKSLRHSVAASTHLPTAATGLRHFVAASASPSPLPASRRAQDLNHGYSKF
ncbi:hypothetical protein GUJ93_ZPchr0008g12140 [Zizania palustris]|uniref:Uncharacterized protein n=1 Tax=Zizania palustris TaxID=103762 RepID=A0A8J5VFP2_ZIZPA|nr:hypothetical protein GUJ93_ZPchr0008g12140 [Zizania palustris]